MLIWLHYRTPEALAFAKSYLLADNGTGNDIEGNPKPYTSSGLKTLYAGEEAAEYFGTSTTDPRVPDLFGIAQYGVVYTGGQGKIAEHGGANPQDRDVPLVVSGGPVDQHAVDSQTVETTQIAPTILSLLGPRPGRARSGGDRRDRNAGSPLAARVGARSMGARADLLLGRGALDIRDELRRSHGRGGASLTATLAPAASFLPLCGFCETTNPDFAVAPFSLVTRPSLQSALFSAFLTAASFLAPSRGTRHCGGLATELGGPEAGEPPLALPGTFAEAGLTGCPGST